MPLLITSRNNPNIKRALSLRKKKVRQQEGAFLVEGIRHIGEAVEAQVTIGEIFFCPELLDSDFAKSLIEDQIRYGVRCHATTVDVFKSLAEKQNPQGILAIVRQSVLTVDDLPFANFATGVALVSPQDPGNVGTILRTVDAVGGGGLFLLDGGVDAYHPSSVRASMGAIFWHPIISTETEIFNKWAKENDYHIYGTSAHGGMDFLDFKEFITPWILLMGSEREGLNSDQKELCEFIIRIPMHGKTTSLNLSVAAGIMLYHMMEKSITE